MRNERKKNSKRRRGVMCLKQLRYLVNHWLPSHLMQREYWSYCNHVACRLPVARYSPGERGAKGLAEGGHRAHLTLTGTRILYRGIRTRNI